MCNFNPKDAAFIVFILGSMYMIMRICIEHNSSKLEFRNLFCLTLDDPINP